jgi:hypothetical protein
MILINIQNNELITAAATVCHSFCRKECWPLAAAKLKKIAAIGPVPQAVICDLYCSQHLSFPDIIPIIVSILHCSDIPKIQDAQGSQNWC